MSADLAAWLLDLADACSGLRPVGAWPGEKAAAKLREAAAALEAAWEDAERYRWLRDRHDRTHQDWHVRDQWNNAPAIGDLDAAIDRAIGEQA